MMQLRTTASSSLSVAVTAVGAGRAGIPARDYESGMKHLTGEGHRDYQVRQSELGLHRQETCRLYSGY